MQSMPDPPDHTPSASKTGSAERFWQEFAHSPPRRQPREGRRATDGENGREGPGAGSADAGDPGDGTSKSDSVEYGSGHECLEWCPICRGVDVLRAAGAPEVRGQLAALQRDSLLAVKALVDAYAERSAGQEPGARPRESSPPVQDIPID